MNERAVCSCIPDMLGSPPNCRPECVIHQDCPSDRACDKQKCIDPCVGSCGFNAQCSVKRHQPTCTCFEGHEGDPYAGCNVRQGECYFYKQKNFTIFTELSFSNKLCFMLVPQYQHKSYHIYFMFMFMFSIDIFYNFFYHLYFSTHIFNLVMYINL